jgi:hypothetical protein
MFVLLGRQTTKTPGSGWVRGNPPTVFSAGDGEALRMDNILAEGQEGGKERLANI